MNKKNNKCPLFCGIEVDAYRLEWIGQEHKGPAGRAVFASLGRVGGRGKHWQTVDGQTDRRMSGGGGGQRHKRLVGWQVVVAVVGVGRRTLG